MTLSDDDLDAFLEMIEHTLCSDYLDYMEMILLIIMHIFMILM